MSLYLLIYIYLFIYFKLVLLILVLKVMFLSIIICNLLNFIFACILYVYLQPIILLYPPMMTYRCVHNLVVGFNKYTTCYHELTSLQAGYV